MLRCSGIEESRIVLIGVSVSVGDVVEHVVKEVHLKGLPTKVGKGGLFFDEFDEISVNVLAVDKSARKVIPHVGD